MRKISRGGQFGLCASLVVLVTLFCISRESSTTSNVLRRLRSDVDTVNNIQQSDGSIDRRTQAVSPAIVTLVTDQSQVNDLCDSMKTLVNIQGNTQAPVLIFHLENEPSDQQKEFLSSCTDRNVYFPIVDLDDYPEGFIPDPEVDYTDAQINRFWTTGLWEHPALGDRYDFIMRIDGEACFAIPNAMLPNLATPYQNYHSHYFPGTVELNPRRLNGMFDFAFQYMKDNQISNHYPQLWTKIAKTHEAAQTLPTFKSEFEIVRVSFMRSQQVRDFHTALTELPPYGYFTHGWNDEAERFLTAALFGSPSSIYTEPVPGFIQKSRAMGKLHEKACLRPFESS